MRRTFCGIGLAVLVIMLSFPAGCGKERKNPHLVLIILDALHAGHVSHLGYSRETTGNLDRLAGEGVTYTRVLAPAPYTLASIPSILTGRMPDTHGLTQKTSPPLSSEEITLAEMVKRKGYRTLGAVATGNGSAVYGLDQGFDEFIEVFMGEGGPDQVTVEKDGVPMHIPRADEFLPVMEQWLHGTDGKDPTFFYLHILEPHSPYTPPEPFRERFVDPGYDGPFCSGGNRPLIETVRGKRIADAEGIRATIDLYDANVAWADHIVGRLLRKLREAGLYDEALIVVTSDHGEAFWQHGKWGHNYQLYEEMLHVPLVVKFPKGDGPVGKRVDRMASLTDLVPSICQWLDLQKPEKAWDGRPLEGSPERALFLRSHHEIPHLALRTAEGKLIVIPGADEGQEAFQVEFYDLKRDPEERNNLAGKLTPWWSEKAKQLKEVIPVLSRSKAKRSDPLSASQAELLKALGY